MTKFWKVLSKKLDKAEKGICYCKEEEALNKMQFFPFEIAACIFCYNKTKDALKTDTDDVYGRMKQFDKDMRKY